MNFYTKVSLGELLVALLLRISVGLYLLCMTNEEAEIWTTDNYAFY